MPQLSGLRLLSSLAGEDSVLRKYDLPKRELEKELDFLMNELREQQESNTRLQKENKRAVASKRSLEGKLREADRRTAIAEKQQDYMAYDVELMKEKMSESEVTHKQIARENDDCTLLLKKARNEFHQLELKQAEMSRRAQESERTAADATRTLAKLRSATRRQGNQHHDHCLQVLCATEASNRSDDYKEEEALRKLYRDDKRREFLKLLRKRASDIAFKPTRFGGGFTIFVTLENSSHLTEISIHWGCTYSELRKKMNVNTYLSNMRSNYYFKTTKKSMESMTEVRLPFVPVKTDVNEMMKKLRRSYGCDSLKAITDINEEQWQRRGQSCKSFGFTLPIITVIMKRSERTISSSCCDLLSRTKLHIAAETGDVDTLQDIISSKDFGKGTLATQRNSQGMTPAHIAASRGFYEFLSTILSHVPTLHREPDQQGRTPLHHAAYNAHLQCIKVLISVKADPNTLDYNFRKPMHAAAASGNVECVKLLQSVGGVKELPSNLQYQKRYTDSTTGRLALWGWSAEPVLQVVCGLPDEKASNIVDALLGEDFDVPFSRLLGRVPGDQSFCCTKSVFSRRAQSSSPPIINRTALISATQQRKPQLMKSLLLKGIDVESANHLQLIKETALQGYSEGLAILLQYIQTDLISRSLNVLDLAITSNDEETIQVALEWSGIPTHWCLTSVFGIPHSILFTILIMGNCDLLVSICKDYPDLCLEPCCGFNENSNSGNTNKTVLITPLWLAAYFGRPDLVHILQQFGAFVSEGLLQTQNKNYLDNRLKYVELEGDTASKEQSEVSSSPSPSPSVIDKSDKLDIIANCIGVGLLDENIPLTSLFQTSKSASATPPNTVLILENVPTSLKNSFQMTQLRLECFKAVMTREKGKVGEYRCVVFNKKDKCLQVKDSIIPLSLAVRTGDVELIKLTARKSDPKTINRVPDLLQKYLIRLDADNDSWQYIATDGYLSGDGIGKTRSLLQRVIWFACLYKRTHALRYLLTKISVDLSPIFTNVLRLGDTFALSQLMLFTETDPLRQMFTKSKSVIALLEWPGQVSEELKQLLNYIDSSFIFSIEKYGKKETLATISSKARSQTLTVICNTHKQLVTATNEDGMTPLHISCIIGDLTGVMKLLGFGASLLLCDKSQKIPEEKRSFAHFTPIGRNSKPGKQTASMLKFVTEQWELSCGIEGMAPLQYLTPLCRSRLQRSIGKGSEIGSKLLLGLFSGYRTVLSVAHCEQLFFHPITWRGDIIVPWEPTLCSEPNGLPESAILEIFPVIESSRDLSTNAKSVVSLYASKVKKPNRKLIGLLSSRGAALDELDLSGSYLGKKTMECITNDLLPNLPKLRTLSLNNCRVTNLDVSSICKTAANHPSLTSLGLNDNPDIFLEGGSKLRALKQQNRMVSEITVTGTGLSQTMISLIHSPVAAAV